MTYDEIKKLRMSLNLTRQQFAEKIQYSPRTVEAWEQGHQAPSKRAVAAMERVSGYVNGYIIKFGEVTPDGDVYEKGCINQDSIDKMKATK